MTASVIVSPSFASASALSFAKNHRRNFLRSIFFVAHFHFHSAVGFHDFVRHQFHIPLHFFVFKSAPDETLDGKQSIFRIGDGLAFRQEARPAFHPILKSRPSKASSAPLLCFRQFLAIRLPPPPSRSWLCPDRFLVFFPYY